MNIPELFINLGLDLLREVSALGEWLISPIGIGEISFTPIAVFSATGLLVLLGIALARFLLP